MCIPSKTLLRSGETLSEAGRARVLAASRVEWAVDFPRVSKRALWMARDLDDARPAAAVEATGARLVRGEGKLTDLRTVAVGSEQLVARRGVVIATGSTAAIPPIPGLHTVHTAVPRVTFTDPEIASVGLSEAAARAKGIDVVVASADPAETARGYIHDFHGGALKLVADRIHPFPAFNRVLGASLAVLAAKVA